MSEEYTEEEISLLEANIKLMIENPSAYRHRFWNAMMGHPIEPRPRHHKQVPSRKPETKLNAPGNRFFRRQLAAEARGKIRHEDLSFKAAVQQRLRAEASARKAALEAGREEWKSTGGRSRQPNA